MKNLNFKKRVALVEKAKAKCRGLAESLRDPQRRALLCGIVSFLILGYCWTVFAGGSDILQGTDASLWATLNGTGKKYIYAAEGILGLAAYMKTKNLLVLTGIVVVSIFFNIILSIAGESA